MYKDLQNIRKRNQEKNLHSISNSTSSSSGVIASIASPTLTTEIEHINGSILRQYIKEDWSVDIYAQATKRIVQRIKDIERNIITPAKKTSSDESE